MQKPIKHIVIFAIDGLASYQLEQNLAPVFKMLMSKGAYTLDNRSVIPIVCSSNWTSIFCGVSPSFHGRTQWNSVKAELVNVYSKLRKSNPESLFHIFKQQRKQKSVGFFRGHLLNSLFNIRVWDYWTNIIIEGEELILNKKLKQTQFIEKIDNMTANELVVQAFCNYLQNEAPELSLIYVNEPDVTGHNFGYQTDVITQTIEQLGLWVEKVLQAINSNVIMKDETLFVLVSDHGGKGKGDDCHGNFNDQELKTPIFFYGAGVVNPGMFFEKTIQYDIAATLAWLLGLEIPLYWQGKVIYSPFKADSATYYYIKESNN